MNDQRSAIGMAAGIALVAMLIARGGSVAASDDVGPAVKQPGAACEAPLKGHRWLSAWGGTRMVLGGVNESTFRSITRVTADGPAIRLRFFNLNTTASIVIGRATVAIRDGTTGAALKPETLRPVTFNCGQASATIPPGTASFYSDPIELPVATQDDVAVSLYVQGSGNAGEHAVQWSFSYFAPAGSGDLTATAAGTRFTAVALSAYALRDVEVLTREANGAIVFLGSSSVQGYNSTPDAHRRFTDAIAARMAAEFPGRVRQTVVNRGIGADTLERAYRTRMEQDVWSTAGVASVVVWVVNDLSSRTADAVIADYLSLIADARARRVNVICPTWPPGAQSTLANWNGERDRLNEWILHSGNCDAVVDYDAVVRHETLPNTWKPEYFSDGIHTNDAGHAAWAAGTPISDWVALGHATPIAKGP